MAYHNRTFGLEVWGDYACFTRPEMKVERVSYDVPTPSSVRGIFEAIFWKPAFRWEVRRIEVLNPIRWTSVRRNEVGAVMSGREGLFVEDHRQQRAGLLLQDVAYRMYADMVYLPPGARPPCPRPASAARVDPEERPLLAGAENPGKYYAMFERRARKGQCFNQPYLGCREFSVSGFRLVEPDEPRPAPIAESQDLGFMLYDLDYGAPGGPAPLFFRARMDLGVIAVPDPNGPEVRR